MYRDGTYTINGVEYTFDANGVLTEESEFSPEPDGLGYVHFYNFEQLKQLIARYPEWTKWEYAGTDELVITEDIALPEVALRSPINIPAGVTLTSGASSIIVSVLVDGVLINRTGCNIIATSTRMAVNGSLLNAGTITVMGADLTGRENIDNSGGGSVFLDVRIRSVEDLNSFLLQAETDSDEHYQYGAGFYSTVTLDRDITISQKVLALELSPIGGLIIPQGVSFDLRDSRLTVYGVLQIDGSLNNDGVVYIQPYGVQEGTRIQLGETGDYSGEGIIRIHADDSTAPEKILFGFDWERFEITQEGNDMVLSLKHVPPILGDVNFDGRIDADDALQILRYAEGLSSVFDPDATDDERLARQYLADVNADGAVDGADALELQRYAIGLRTAF